MKVMMRLWFGLVLTMIAADIAGSYGSPAVRGAFWWICYEGCK